MIKLKDAELVYHSDFIEAKQATVLLNLMLENFPWSQDHIKLFGREVLQPRLTCLFAENKRSYTYSNLTLIPEPFPEILIPIKERLEQILGQRFTTCLVNLYRDGQDSMGWHSDDEKELGQNPTIASISFGAERIFHLKHKKDKSHKFKLILKHGSLLVMKGATQHFWQHQLPKTKKLVGPRINLTFRKID